MTEYIHISGNLKSWTLFIKKFFTTHACFCFYNMEFRKEKNIFCPSKASLWFTQKNNFFVMNKIKLVWFYSLYRNYSFEEKGNLFIHFKNIFYHVTLENIFRILNNSVYFQNIVVYNEPLKAWRLIPTACFSRTHMLYQLFPNITCELPHFL